MLILIGPGGYQHAPISKCDCGGIPSSSVTRWPHRLPHGPFFGGGIVDSHFMRATVIVQVAPNDEQFAIRQKSMTGTKEIDPVGASAQSRTLQRDRRQTGVFRVPDTGSGFVRIETGSAGLGVRERCGRPPFAPAPEQHLAVWQDVHMNGNV